MACKQVEEGYHNSELILTDEGNTYLYQAYLGRIQASTIIECKLKILQLQKKCY